MGPLFLYLPFTMVIITSSPLPFLLFFFLLISHLHLLFYFINLPFDYYPILILSHLHISGPRNGPLGFALGPTWACYFECYPILLLSHSIIIPFDYYPIYTYQARVTDLWASPNALLGPVILNVIPFDYYPI